MRMVSSISPSLMCRVSAYRCLVDWVHSGPNSHSKSRSMLPDIAGWVRTLPIRDLASSGALASMQCKASRSKAFDTAASPAFSCQSAREFKARCFSSPG